MADAWANKLHFGDNLHTLRGVAAESVDLVYLDPPFNSSADYNVLFKNQSGEVSAAQTTAFKDTWEWDEAANRAFHELMTLDVIPGRLKKLMESLKLFLTGDTGNRGNGMMAYLTMMALRLVELHRVLKPTGSLYLHCDPTASHYIRLILDAIFGWQNFRNEIIWQRTLSKGLATKRLPRNHDVILNFTRTELAKWNQEFAFKKYDESALDPKTAEKYRLRDPDGRRYQLDSLINPSRDRPNLTYEFLGVTRVWRWTRERMQRAYEAGLVVQTRPGAVPRGKRYLDEQRGKPIGDIWSDIPPINSQAREALGYPTQKPEELLERIIRLSTDENDVVLDPFCGCGTTISVAERLKRRWIGIDVTYLAVDLMERRLLDQFTPGSNITRLADIPVGKRRQALKSYWDSGEDVLGIGLGTGLSRFEVLGVPQSVEDARFLWENDRFQFEWWCVAMVGAQGRMLKGADKGVDGVIVFLDSKDYKRALVSVKGGANIKREMVATLKGDMAREGAVSGVMVTLEEPTKPMKQEAADAGMWTSEFNGKSFPVIQILTVKEILNGHGPQLPQWAPKSFKVAPKGKSEEQHPQLF